VWEARRPARRSLCQARSPRALTGETFTATAGNNGRFTLSLPPGSYHVAGRSPLMQSGQMICAATAELRVTRNKPAGSVTVVCSIP
jgi:hypothetical protein